MEHQHPADSRQFVACKFKPWDQRSYTYHNDGAPVAVGDRVTVETAKGTQTVTVDALVPHAPTFPTKPILGLAPPPDEEPPAATEGFDPVPQF